MRLPGPIAYGAIALVVVAAATAAIVVASAEEPATIAWRTDLAAAHVEAAKERKPLLVVFRCPP